MSASTTFALTQRLVPLDLAERLIAIRAAVAGRLVFTTSFGLEDQALTHALVTAGVDVAFATLDTGRLFPETLDVWARTQARYGIRIASFAPEATRVEALVAADGVDGFYRSLEARKACCHARKVEPLARVLRVAAGWITGLRADQSNARGETPLAVDDVQHRLVKFNPLADWSRERVADYVRAHAVPINALHERGFLSIGCAPCSRAVAPGEPERAGRWWWEDAGKKECGLHVGSDGRLTPLGRPSVEALT
jgi:phosphoadenosine phosphosulfate reductase